jgi:hypothetical protein
MQTCFKFLSAACTCFATTLLALAAMAVPTQMVWGDSADPNPTPVLCNQNGGTSYCSSNYKNMDDCNVTAHGCDDNTPPCHCRWAPNPANFCSCQDTSIP